MSKHLVRLAALSALLACSACGSDDNEADPAAVVAQYTAIVKASYADSVSGAQSLRTAITAFLAAPSADTLTAARNAWIAARPAYQQTEAYRFYGGPIDDPNDDREIRINSWPLDETYIDGLIDGEDTIDKAFLIAKNFENGETNISTGWHAIEYLLWGKDTSTTGPGDRPFTDYTGDATDGQAVRRSAFLAAAADLLVDDLSFVASRWDGNYATELATVGTNEALRRMLTGIGALALAELSGERMRVAYEDRDQEDEHSCFSDNTIKDLTNNARGIENVYLGRYGSLTGPSLYDLVAAKNQALADTLKQQCADAVTEVDDIPTPFDQAILDDTHGRIHVLNAIDAVTAAGDSIVAAATALGISINANP